jgi:2,3-bisphosphoglycerate-independent phosphoglycerate mutase
MKYVIVLPDGAADEPLPQLGGRTPLEAARIPNMDWVAQNGHLGSVVTIPTGYLSGTDVGTLSLLGANPDLYYSGRAPLEALAKGLTAKPDQLIFRCNFVTIVDGMMEDFTAGHITQEDADELIATLNSELGSEGCEFHPGVSYRNLLLLDNSGDMELRCVPPHDIPNQPVAEHQPKGKGIDRINWIMERGAQILANHPVNQRRIAAKHLPATNIWLWGQGGAIPLESIQSRFGLSSVTITAVDIIRGIAVGMGMELIEVPGATGYIDTDYDAKGAAAVAALDRYDLVVVHVEAADEAGHLGDAAEKVKALERIDEAVVGPLLEALKSRGDFRILIAPDHPTPVSTKAHSSTPPPFCMAGSGIQPGSGLQFSEVDARTSARVVDPGHTLLGQFLKR